MTAKEALKQASSFKDDYGLETTYNKDKTEAKGVSDNKAYKPITSTDSQTEQAKVNQKIVAVQSD